MKLLSRTEEIILLSIWKLQDNAYGISIRRHIHASAGINWSFGAIYAPLNRLLRKGLISASEGEPTPERGGRRKIYYHLTPVGKAALREIEKLNREIWSGIPSLESSNG